jgi:hypothetical protein
MSRLADTDVDQQVKNSGLCCDSATITRGRSEDFIIGIRYIKR